MHIIVKKHATVDWSKKSEASENILSWMAGFFDGEGSLSIKCSVTKSGLYQLKRNVTIVNTDLECLKIFKQYFGGTIAVRKRSGDRCKNWKQIYHWSVTGDSSAYFIGCIMGFLKLKKLRAEIYMSYQRELDNLTNRNHASNPQYLETSKYMCSVMKKLNQRGVPCTL